MPRSPEPTKEAFKGSASPKLTVFRMLSGKLAATARRYFGEIARAQPSPTSALTLRDDMERSLLQIIQADLARSNLPVVTSADPVPTGPYWLIEPLGGRRNALHARLPVSCAYAFVEGNGDCNVGGVYFPLEDVMVVAEAGAGSSGSNDTKGRFRTAGRIELTDGMLLLPWSTADVLSLKLLEKAESMSMHTRKTGHALFDVIDVAAGRADAVVATRLTRIEALLARLILGESNAAVSDLKGQPITAQSTSLVAANVKLHGKLLKLLNS